MALVLISCGTFTFNIGDFLGHDFVAINLEAANSNNGSVCAVGLVRVRGNEIVARESFLVRPDETIGHFEKEITARHGIAAEDVAGAPTWVEALPRVTAFVQHDFVVVHEGPFTAAAIKLASEAAGVDQPDLSYYSTMDLVKNAVPTLEDRNLKSVAKAMKLGGLDVKDAEQVAAVTALICTKLAGFSGVQSLTALMKGYKVPVSVIGRGREYVVEHGVAVPDVPVVKEPVARAVLEAPEPATAAMPEVTSSSAPVSRRARRALDQSPSGKKSQPEVAPSAAEPQVEVVDRAASTASDEDSRILLVLPIVPLLVAVGLWFMNMPAYAFASAVAFVCSIPLVIALYVWNKRHPVTVESLSDNSGEDELKARAAGSEAAESPAVSVWTGQIIQARHVLDRTQKESPRGRRAREVAKNAEASEHEMAL
jgi:DNA polymerase-3 subunit epsilon